MFGATSTFGGGGALSNTQTSTFGGGSSLFNAQATAANYNPMKDIEVPQPPDDSVSSMKFSPPSLPANFLAAGSWDNNIYLSIYLSRQYIAQESVTYSNTMVRCWEVQTNGTVIPKAMQTHAGPVLDVAWSDDGTKIFTASADKTAKMWDLNSNQSVQIAQHDAPVKTCHWIKSSNYSCLMTGSWDKTLKFWDTRTPNPIMTMQVGERVYCADVLFPMAIVGTANRGIVIYQLDNVPQEFKRMESPLKYQHRCVAIFGDRKANAANPPPVGFALGSIEGRVAIQYVAPQNPKDNFTFKCHRSNGTTGGPQDIYAVNSIAFHPVHGTLATVGSDGRFSFWDKDARTKLKTSEQVDQPISSCSFNRDGNIFAYASSYDWSKGHEGYDAQKMKPHILLRSCFEELKQSQKKP